MRIFTSILLTGFACFPLIGFAHHSHSNLNMKDVRVYTGVITKYGWTMPHVYMKVKGADPEGNVVEYSIEMDNPSSMARQGWSKQTFNSGDRITWEGAHDRNPSRHYTGLSWVERADGTRVGIEGAETTNIEPSTDFYRSLETIRSRWIQAALQAARRMATVDRRTSACDQF